MDPDERASGYVARGYTPGLVSQLAGRLSDTVAELEAEREKIERGERVQARAAREHAAGRVDALSMQRMLDGDFGDAHRAEQLEKRAAGIRRQIAEAQEAISPPQQRDLNPVESASRHAHDAFVEATRAMMDGSRPIPSEPRPFGYASCGAGDDAEPDCEDCRALVRAEKRPATAADAARIHRSWAARHGEGNRAAVAVQHREAYDAEIARLVEAGFSRATAELAMIPAAG